MLRCNGPVARKLNILSRADEKCEVTSVVLLQLLCTTYGWLEMEMAMVFEVCGEPEFTVSEKKYLAE